MSRIPVMRVLARVGLAWLVFAAVTHAQSSTIAIRAGHLIDPDAGTAAVNQIILIDGGRITAVGSNLAIPAGARVIDLSHATVLPGLFDAHTHLCMSVKPARDNSNYFFTSISDPDTLRAVEGVANARGMLEAGFTSVRDVGNEGNYACVSVRRGIERGLVPGPSMITAGRIIAPFGGQFQLQPDKRGIGEPEYAYADSRDEMRKAVRENAHFGATVIKIVIDDQSYIYSADDIRFIKAEAAAAGLKLAAHAWTPAGAHNAAEAAVDSIEHAPDITDADLALMKKNDVALVGTEYLALRDPERGRWIDRLQRAVRAKVTLVYGTDVIDDVPGQTRGTEAMRGVDVWIEAQVPARTLVQAMTTNAARLLGVADRRGAIKVGLAADIIATAENPLERPAALQHAIFVMKDGRVVRQ